MKYGLPKSKLENAVDFQRKVQMHFSDKIGLLEDSSYEYHPTLPVPFQVNDW